MTATEPETTADPSASSVTALLLTIDQLTRNLSVTEQTRLAGLSGGRLQADLIRALRDLARLELDSSTPAWLFTADDAGLGLLRAKLTQADSETWLSLRDELDDSQLLEKALAIRWPTIERERFENPEGLLIASFEAEHLATGRPVPIVVGYAFAPADDSAAGPIWSGTETDLGVTVVADCLSSDIGDAIRRGVSDASALLFRMGVPAAAVARLGRVIVTTGPYHHAGLAIGPGNARLITAVQAVKFALNLDSSFRPDTTVDMSQGQTGVELLENTLASTGHSWGAVVRSTAHSGLTDIGWTVRPASDQPLGDPKFAADGEDVIWARTRQQELLVEHFLNDPSRPALLGGGGASGKTTTALLVAAQLTQEHGWRCLRLQQTERRPVSQGDVHKAVHLATTAVTADEKTLVIVDELEPTEQFNDLDHELTIGVGNRPGVSILVLALYGDGGAEWRTDTLRAIPINVNVHDRQDFVVRLFEQSGADKSSTNSLVTPLVQAAASDRWYLARMVRHTVRVLKQQNDSGPIRGSRADLRAQGAAKPRTSGRRAEQAKTNAVLSAVLGHSGPAHSGSATPASAVRQDQDAHVAWMKARIPTEHSSVIRRVATLSLIKLGIPPEETAEVPATVMARLGIHLSADGWRFSGATAARSALLSTFGERSLNEHSLDRLVFSELVEHVESLVATDPVRAAAVVQASSHSSDSAPRKLARLIGGKLTKAATDIGSASTALAILNDLYQFLQSSQRLELLRIALTDLGSRGAAALDQPAFVRCLDALRRDKEMLHDRADKQAFDEAVRAMAEDLGDVVQRLDPTAAVDLLDAAWTLREDDMADAVRRSAPQAFNWADPTQVDHYGALVKMARMFRRMDDGHEALASLRGSIGGALLLDSELVEEKCSLYLGRLAARIVVGEELAVDPLAEEARVSKLHRALFRSDGRDFLAGASLLQSVHRGALMPLLRSPELHYPLHKIITHSSADTITNVLRCIYQHVPRQAVRFIYDESGALKEAFLSTWLKQLTVGADLRDIGRAMRLAAELDTVMIVPTRSFRSRSEPEFSRRLATSLIDGIDAVLSYEDRPDVVRHVLSGLIDCQVPLDLLLRFEVNCRRVVLAGCRSGVTEGAARLAIRLAHDDAFGPEFLEPIYNALAFTNGQPGRHREPTAEADRLAAMIDHARQPAHLEALHALAFALSPQAAAAYQKRFHADDFLRNFPGKRALDVLRALAAISRTLSFAGHPQPGLELLVTTGDVAGWGKRLSQVNHIHIVECIDLLFGMSQPFANAIVDFLAHEDSVRTPGHLKIRTSDNRLRAMVSQKSSNTVSAVAMFRSIAKASPVLARNLARRFADRDQWHGDILGLIDDAEPAELGKTLTKLAWLRVSLPEEGYQRLQQRWRTDIQHLRGIWSMGELLRGLHAIDPNTAADVATRIRYDLLVRRMEEGRTQELPRLANLIGLLDLVGAGNQIPALIDAVPLTAFRRAEPQALAQFALTSFWLGGHSEQVPLLRDQVGKARTDLLQQRFNVDRSRLSMNAGFLSLALREAGGRLEPMECSTAPNHPASRLWLRTFQISPDRTVVDGTVTDRALIEDQELRSWAAVAVLCESANAGLVARFGPDQAQQLTNRALGASPRWLAPLLHFADANPDLKELVRDQLDELNTAVDNAVALGRDGAAEVRARCRHLFGVSAK